MLPIRLLRSFSPLGRIRSLHNPSRFPVNLLAASYQSPVLRRLPRSRITFSYRHLTQHISPEKHAQYRALFKLFEGRNVDSKEKIAQMLFSLGMDPCAESIKQFVAAFERDQTLSYDDFVHMMELRQSPLAQPADVLDNSGAIPGTTQAEEQPRSWLTSKYIAAKVWTL